MRVNILSVFFTILFSLVLLFACSNDFKKVDLNLHKSFTWEGSKVNIHITELSRYLKFDFTSVNGFAEIRNYGTNIKSINLKCLSVTIGNSISETVNVSKFPYTSTKYPLSEKITLLPINWAMNKDVDDTDLHSLSVRIKKDCKLFSNLEWKKEKSWEKMYQKSNK